MRTGSEQLPVRCRAVPAVTPAQKDTQIPSFGRGKSGEEQIFSSAYCVFAHYFMCKSGMNAKIYLKSVQAGFLNRAGSERDG